MRFSIPIIDNNNTISKETLEFFDEFSICFCGGVFKYNKSAINSSTKIRPQGVFIKFSIKSWKNTNSFKTIINLLKLEKSLPDYSQKKGNSILESCHNKSFPNYLIHFFMKKLLFALSSIAAMIIVSSCSADSVEDATKENAINKNQISQSAITNTVLSDSIPQTNTAPIDDGDPIRP